MLRSFSQSTADDDTGSRVALSLDLEKSFLSLIKLQCGNSSVLKIEGMLNDLYVSETTKIEFQRRYTPVEVPASAEDQLIERDMTVVDVGDGYGMMTMEMVAMIDAPLPSFVSLPVCSPLPGMEEKAEEEKGAGAGEESTGESLVDASLKKEKQGEAMPAFHVLLLTQNFWPTLVSSFNAATAAAVILPKPLGKIVVLLWLVFIKCSDMCFSFL